MTLEGKKLAVGAKVAKKALDAGRVEMLYLACDASESVVGPLRSSALEKGVPVVEDSTMRELGRAAGIAIGAGAVTVLKD